MIRLGLVAPQPAQQANPAEQGDVPMHGADAGQGGGDGMNLDDVAIDRNLPDSPARSNGGDPPNDPVDPPLPQVADPPPPVDPVVPPVDPVVPAIVPAVVSPLDFLRVTPNYKQQMPTNASRFLALMAPFCLS